MSYEADLESFVKACIENDISTATMLLDVPGIKEAAAEEDNVLLKGITALGNTEIVALLLTIDAVKKLADEQYAATFEIGAQEGLSEAESLILEAFVNACQNNDTDTVKRLLNHDTIKSVIPKIATSFLYKIIELGHTEILKLLLEIDEIKEELNTNYDFFLKPAIDNNHLSTVNLLLELGKSTAETEALISQAFENACKNNNIEMVKVLIKEKAVHQYLSSFLGEYVISNLVYKNSLEILKLLIDLDSAKQSIVNQYHKLLSTAIINDYLEIAELFVSIDEIKIKIREEYVDEFINTFNKDLCELDIFILQSFKQASRSNSANIKILMQHDIVKKYCANFDLDFLENLVLLNSAKVINFFITSGYLNNVASQNDNFLLLLAIENEHPRIAKMLLRIDKVRELAYQNFSHYFEAGKQEGYSEVDVLHLIAFEKACIKNDLYLARKLAKNTVVQKFFSTPTENFLKEVIRHNDTSLLALILKLSPGSLSKAFLLACENGNLSIVKYLLEFNDIKACSADNDNLALQKAVKNGHDEIATLLFETAQVKEKLISASAENPTQAASLALLYAADISTISEIIFIDESENTKNEPIEPTTYTPHVVHNNTQYINAFTTYIGDYRLGKPLFVDETQTNPTPIGYNIHLPPEGIPIKNVIISIYGGSQTTEKSTRVSQPGRLNALEDNLVKNGTIIIQLNLPDLLKLNVYQAQMPEALHQEIHEAIHKFFRTLKHSPESLHESLQKYDFKSLKIFLWGASFGGRTAIRHAELYPGTYDGYISHDGYLSFEMSKKADIISRPQYATYLDPSPDSEIKKISEPILLLQNMDDNNVNAKVTLDFYKKLVKNRKADLARTCITEVGNPIPSKKATNKGHHFPETKEGFTHYTSAITGFMENGPTALPAVTTWQAYRYNKLANKHYKSGTLKQRFIAEVLNQSRLDKQANERIKAFGLNKSEEVWDEHYKPLFYSLYYAQKLLQDKNALTEEIRRLEQGNLLSEDAIKNALALQANVISNYFKEQYNITVSSEDIKNNPHMIVMFKRQIFNLDKQKPAVVKFMLEVLYQANPKLLTPKYSDFENDTQLQNNASLTKEKLKRTISRERALVQNVWQAAAKERLSLTRFEKLLTKIKEIKQQPSNDKNNYVELISLLRPLLNDPKRSSAATAEIDNLIKHFESLQPRDESITMELIYAKMTKWILTQDTARIESTKDEATDLLMQIKHPTDTKQTERESCRKAIEEDFAILSKEIYPPTKEQPTQKRRVD